MSEPIHPACALCKGACCEGIRLPLGPFKGKEEIDRWLEYHGMAEEQGQAVYLECRCTKLVDGLCSVYSSRPRVCRKFGVGSVGCMKAIARNRPGAYPEIVKLIKG